MSASVTSSPVASVPKGRKGSAAGGGKAWTEEEEVYLLQMRLQKVAYKKIATHLDKTELACRLHYHQLSHGGNRRKRTNSMSSNTSDKSSMSPVLKGDDSLTPSSIRTPTQPRLSNISSNGAIQKLSANSPSQIRGKPLLPKPPKSSDSKANKLRVNCDAGSIDRERLQRIIEAQNKQFWASVAAQYGGGQSAEYLEMCWNNGLKSGPPTPAISPQSKVSSPITDCVPEEAGTPESMNSMTMETISELPDPQPLIATMNVDLIPEPATVQIEDNKLTAVEVSADVAMDDIPEASESEAEANWSD